MPFNRVFDEEIGRAAANACLNDGAVLDLNTYCLGLTTTDAEIASVAPGIYHAFIAGMSAAATVLITVTRETETIPVPVDGTPAVATIFPGNVVARIRVLPGKKVVTARLLVTGAEDLYLVPVVGL